MNQPFFESDLDSLAQKAFCGLIPALWLKMKDKGNPGGRSNGTIVSAAEAAKWIRLLTPQEVEAALDDELIRTRVVDDSGAAYTEFFASEVLAHHQEQRKWTDLANQDPVYKETLIEDYALWSTKRKYGDHRPYQVEIL